MRTNRISRAFDFRKHRFLFLIIIRGRQTERVKGRERRKRQRADDERKKKRGTSEKKRVTKNCILENFHDDVNNNNNDDDDDNNNKARTSKTLSKCSTFVFEDDDEFSSFRFCRPRDLLAIIYFISI